MKYLFTFSLFLIAEGLYAAPKIEKNEPSRFFGSRKPLYDCNNEKSNHLSFYTAGAKISLPPGISLTREGKTENLELTNTKSQGKTVTSDVYRFEGFTKIVQKVNHKDSKTKQEKVEVTKVLIDEVLDESKTYKYVATLEKFEGSDSGKALLSEKFDCTKSQ